MGPASCRRLEVPFELALPIDIEQVRNWVSSFGISVMAASRLAATQSAVSSADGHVRRPHILYMEDSITAARLFQLKLEREGYVVDIAGDGDEGLDLSANITYDLIALDYNMPKYDGISVLRALSARGDMPPVIMVTADNDVATAVEAMRLGASDYLLKSEDATYLLLLPTVIRRALEKRRLEEERERTIEELHLQNRNLTLLNKVGQFFTSSQDVQEITGHLVRAICEFTDTEGSSVWLWDTPTSERLACVAIYSDGKRLPPSQLSLSAGQGIAGWVAQNGESVIVADAHEDTRFSPSSDSQLQFQTRSLLAIPLRAQDTIIGVLELVNKRKGTFDQSDQMLAETLASSAAIAVQNARLLNQARERSAELQVRNEELDAFAHTVAHDLKTPLSLVMGFADMLRESIPQLEEAEISDYLNQIVEHSSRMSQIIEALLLLAGAHGTQGVTPEPVAMGEIIAEALRRLEVVLEQNKVELSLPDDWPLVTGYGPWLEEVWANYLLNGVKYGGKPPQLVLGWEPENETHIRFWIQDNGSGIKLEKGTLFTPLSRSNNGPRNGHGLGLSIVKRIVTRLNGEVGADSEPGIGSRFWFTLPLATDEEFDTE